MNSDQFKECGHEVIEYVANYLENIRNWSVLPNIEPGYMNNRIPDEVPEDGEQWQNLIKDFDRIILPGITHWQSPRFHAFYPTANSYPSIIGEIFSAALSVIGLHWTASPACTELEVKMMNWLGKLLHLPDNFLNCSPGPGGGVLQGSASEVTLLCLLVAKSKSLRRLKKLHPELNEDEIKAKLVAYTTDQANSSVEKAGLLGSMKMRILESDNEGRMDKETFKYALENDIKNGLFPCYLISTLGSTATCAFDQIDLLGPVCKSYNVWLHVDAAYAGAALILPEYKYLRKGIEYADSFNFNPHKWLLVNFDCSALWVQNANDLTNALVVDRIYLTDHDNVNSQLPEYRNWQIPLGRRFRALKLWFTLRSYGKSGLQNHLRNHIKLANLFASLVTQDSRFEIASPPTLGLVCFRLKGDNQLTQELHNKLMVRKNIYMIPGTVNEKLVLRFVICSRFTVEDDVHYAWTEIISQAEEVLSTHHVLSENGYSN